MTHSYTDAPASAPQTDGANDRRYAWLILSVLVLAVAAYVGSVGFCIRWQERAATQAEFFRRARVSSQIYKPLCWVRNQDPSGQIHALIECQYRLGHNAVFDPNKLP